MSDDFTVDERVNLLFKKVLNKPCTNLGREFYEEPSIVSRNFVFPEDIVSVAIPLSAPLDLKNLTDLSLDDNGNLLKGSYAGKTSALFPNIKYYHKIPLEFMVGSSANGYMAFQAIDAQTSHPGGGTSFVNNYGRVLQNSIPFNHAPDGSYGVLLYKNTMDALPFGPFGGGWVVDARPGVVTFFQFSKITGVGEVNPIYASFYRYVGPTGVSGATTVNNFSARQIFTGGEDASTGDQLAAIQIDSRDVKSLQPNEMLDAIQIGGNYDYSWRICVVNTDAGSSFLIQTRQGNAWVSKTTLSATALSAP